MAESQVVFFVGNAFAQEKAPAKTPGPSVL